MELKHLKLIKTIADEGNIANSSEKLFLTQSALSHQLKEIESHLGFKVFYRKRNAWKLTEEGKEMYQLATNVLTSIDEKLRHIQTINNSLSKKIRISCECYSFYSLFPRFSQNLSLLKSSVEVQYVFGATHNPLPQLLSGDIDIALVTKPTLTEALYSINVLNDELYVVMHKTNKFSKKPFIEANDFSQLNLMIHSYPLESVSVYEHFLKPNNIIPQQITAIPLTEVALAMINANLGVMCVAKWMLRLYNLNKDIVFRPIGRNGLHRSLYVVIRSIDKEKEYMKPALELLKKSMQSENN